MEAPSLGLKGKLQKKRRASHGFKWLSKKGFTWLTKKRIKRFCFFVGQKQDKVFVLQVDLEGLKW